MKLLKKDWLYDVKLSGAIGLIILITFAMVVMIMGKVTGIMPIDNAVQVYNKTYGMIALVISFYPIMAFKAVCPQLGSDKLYMSTANLPMSRKEVFFKGLKPWLIIAPMVIIAGAIGSIALSAGAESFKEIIFIITFTPVVILSFTAIIQFQIISGIIFTLGKGIKWYKVVGAIFVFDFILIAMCSIGIRVFKVDTAHDPWWMSICGVFILMASLIVFLIAWRDIEKVYQ